MKEIVYYNYRIVAWVVAYSTGTHDYAPIEFTFEEEPSEDVLNHCRTKAQAAFEKVAHGPV